MIVISRLVNEEACKEQQLLYLTLKDILIAYSRGCRSKKVRGSNHHQPQKTDDKGC